ncbi:hydroxyacid dehydrogenase [Chelativorans sp. AA-79]|uniref:hydroxyacid dehydrogenase n=1 Tax=Chelativorans sp. AA-79 TaxID=3028735 RepID=UPI0023F8997B|nr:hydroxyacid dehydrogenase [Chelativorans sp. AA-79]WEX09812.1 hydroxyacid dehydrogenase [Chelativorans sp. AA-79]
MPEIVISEFMDEAAVEHLCEGFDTLYDPSLVDRPAELAAALQGARALVVRNRTQVRVSLLEAATALECVGRLGVGLDNIDTEACAARGIAVYPATGANDLAVAEYVIAMALVLLRGAYGSSTAVAAGAWPRQALIGGEASGRTIGLVGFGAIAREVGRRAEALGMAVIAYDPFLPDDHAAWKGARKVTLERLLADADVVSLHTPLTPDTRHMIDAAAIGRMKKDAVLINAARGGIVDEDALCAALREGRLAGAALDVFEEEPLGAEKGARFQGLKNLVLTPHIAGVTRESNVRVSYKIAQTVLQHLRDKV